MLEDGDPLYSAHLVVGADFASGAKYHVCRGFGAARIVHIRGRVAADYSPNNNVRSCQIMDSLRDVPLAYTAKL